jgi:peptide/nickel transport system substrate-binding protein
LAKAGPPRTTASPGRSPCATGVKFHDGSDFTVDDVIAKFERAMDPDSGHTTPSYYAAIESVEPAMDANRGRVPAVAAEPEPALQPGAARLDHLPRRQRRDATLQPVGTGPFRFASYVEASEVVLERFEDYYQDGVPYLDRVVFRIIGDAQHALRGAAGGRRST